MSQEIGNKIIHTTKASMSQALEHLAQELRGVRAGRAAPALIEGVTVDAYGSQMKLKELGTISSPEPRHLMVAPFDVSNVNPIIKAIDKANLGVQAMAEGKAVRVVFPEIDQNRRKDLIAQCHRKLEDAKVSIRAVRRDENESVKKGKAAGVIPEDDVKRLEKQI